MLKPSPRTKKTRKTSRQIIDITAKFFDSFSDSFLSKRTEYSAASIRSQKTRGVISMNAAFEYCKIPEVSAKGFTPEILRPDVTAEDWSVLK